MTFLLYLQLRRWIHRTCTYFKFLLFKINDITFLLYLQLWWWIHRTCTYFKFPLFQINDMTFLLYLQLRRWIRRTCTYCKHCRARLYNSYYILEFLQTVLRSSRFLKIKEARSIAGVLRSNCNNIFPFTQVEDRLPEHIQDALRYADSLEKKKRVLEGGASHKQEGEGNHDLPGAKKAKRLKEVYVVNKIKYHSTATADELSSEVDPNELDTEDGHRIIQAIIR